MKDLTPERSMLDPIEIASRDEIEALQLERLKWSLRHAYENVPMYRARFDEKGVHPDDLKSLGDLAKFPFTVKSDLRDHYPFGLFAVPREQIIRVHASSGTTGKPTVVGYTAKDIENWADLVARSMRASGTRRGDIVHVAYGYGLFTGGLGAIDCDAFTAVLPSMVTSPALIAACALARLGKSPRSTRCISRRMARADGYPCRFTTSAVTPRVSRTRSTICAALSRATSYIFAGLS